MRQVLAMGLLMLAAGGCGSDAEETDPAPDTLPQPSGPPLAQQAPPAPAPAPTAGPQWESAVGEDGAEIRLAAGSRPMTIACAAPSRLTVTVTGFAAIGSEDRFALGLGNEPVTLVADPTRQDAGSVTAEGPIPDNLGALLEAAEEITALYGTQQVGPVPAPPRGLADAFAKACERLRK